MDKGDRKNLKKRYLIWFYKTVKEGLDRVERKFSQIEIDRQLLAGLRKLDTRHRAGTHIEAFEAYIRNKEKEGLSAKFKGDSLRPEHYFLTIQLRALEKAIVKELGKKGLEKIKAMYEEEMITRILKSTEH